MEKVPLGLEENVPGQALKQKKMSSKANKLSLTQRSPLSAKFGEVEGMNEAGRETHHEKWLQDRSVKERCPIREKDVPQLLSALTGR